MPFDEPGAQSVLDRVADRIELSDQAADAATAQAIVLTLGTPSFSHVEIDISAIRSVLDDLLPILSPEQLIVLRSTVAPGTTNWVAGYIERRRGSRPAVAHVPERIASGRFLEEIGKLPTIVAGVDDHSTERASELFAAFGAPERRTTPVQAELAKIW